MKLGSWRDVLGRPTGDTQPVLDGKGKFSTFRKGEIYFTEDTGAHAVQGKIREHWHALAPPEAPPPRGPRSYLGYPTSDRKELLGDQGPGRVNTFERGEIYQWPDRVVDSHEVEIRYRGMNCFGDTDESAADEPYPLISIVGPPRRDLDGSTDTSTIHTILGPTERHVVGGGSFPQMQTVYKGPVAGVGGVHVRLMEHDRGDKNAYRGWVEAGVKQRSAGRRQQSRPPRPG